MRRLIGVEFHCIGVGNRVSDVIKKGLLMPCH